MLPPRQKVIRESSEELSEVPLKLGIMSTISPIEIVDLIAALKTQYEGLELRLCDASAGDLRRRLLDGDLEVAVYALPGEQIDDRTHTFPLFNEQMVIAVHRNTVSLIKDPIPSGS